MNQVWPIARREIRSYFDHPTAYILLIAFALVALFVAFRLLYVTGAATLRESFELLPWAFAIFVPAMTMRSFAEERRSGTLEWLAAQPLGPLELVAGKLLGNLLFTLTALAVTVPLAIALLVVSDADPGVMVGQYAGAILLAAQMTAIGIWASSCARAQVTAFILGLAVSWGLVFIGDELILGSFPPALATVAASISMLTRFASVARGVVDLRDLVYFVTTGALFTALAYANVARLRLSPARSGYRRLRLGVGLIAAAVLVINALATQLRVRFDLTRGNLYTLAPATVAELAKLDDRVTIRLFASRGLPPAERLRLREVRDVLADFRSASHGRVRVVELEPDVDRAAEREAMSYGLHPIEFSVLRGDEFQVKRAWFGIAMRYADRQRGFPIVQQTDNLEYQLIASIGSLTHRRRPRVKFLTGYDARTPASYDLWRDQLVARFEVGSIHADSATIPTLSPDSFDVLVVAGPRRTIDTAVVARIERYLDSGGAALLLVDGTDVGPTEVAEPIRTGLEPLLERRGVTLRPGIGFDLRSNERMSLEPRPGRPEPLRVTVPLWPRARPTGKSPITFGLTAVTLPWPTGLLVRDSAAVPLWTTTDNGGRYLASGVPVPPEQPLRPDRAAFGKEVLAVALGAGAGTPGDSLGSRKGSGRMVIVGDADFLETRIARSNPQNPIFATNAIDWLVQDERLIAIRSKDRTPPPLVLHSRTERDVLQWGNWLGVPLIIGLIGLVRGIRRKGRARWTWSPG